MRATDLPVGIDLGTTNSLIGAAVEGSLRIFPDVSGVELLPSAVGVDAHGALLVGRAARNRRLMDPAGTVVSVKRRMGSDVRLRVGTRMLSPPEVSALLLSALLDRATAALGHRPRRAVITVPAYFNDAQRQATRDAGELAGLVVERLLNEPTAAALTYTTGAEELVVVYDLGGGTFDVSVLEREAGLLEVRSSRGDTHLGGDDIDRAFSERVLAQLGKHRAEVERDPRAMTRLTEAVERAKIALSDRTEVRLFDPFLAGEGARALHLDLLLMRRDLEEVARPLVARTLACVDAALRDAGVSAADASRVLLVGGMSKMPLVRHMVAEHLGRPVQTSLDADRAVALGASLLAGRIGGADVDEVLIDITPHTLAVGVIDDIALIAMDRGNDDLMAEAVIPRDTVVPVERSKTVYTMMEDQTAADLPIVQGEHPRVSGNTRLGRVRVDPLPPGPANAPVEVTFRLDLSGVLHVRAQHLPSGKSADVQITESPYRMTEQRRQASRAAVEAFRSGASDPATTSSPSARIPSGAQIDPALAWAMLSRAWRALSAESADDEDARARVRSAADALHASLAAQDDRLADLCDDLSDALLDLL
ncbi:Hsp70 family protein [Chondromyces crocatus]|uniref:Heat-shock protein Hsp70 n=1 Tax=Chondromyces crocatus TaxID=52 RepID=A0A0K1E5X7_CHOCO|nr:Hsp70 family protein [Chondromyces crocatus]AKT35978.1 heat-shock protein Hsp70 [Chondromyces crocatus]